MLQFTKGNLFKADVEAIVNTVNSEGFMGKGIALQFKRAYPDNFAAYVAACKRGEVVTGSVLVVPVNPLDSPIKYVINFPTKAKWRAKSRIEYIETGLESLVREVERLGIRSLGIPPLGCGLGGLPWPKVKERIEQAFASLPDVRVLVFEPGETPPAKEMINNTAKPVLTGLGAAFLKLFDKYLIFSIGTELSLVEMQKLAYFLKLADPTVPLDFAKGTYGPYSDGLRRVLSAYEGHYLTGFGDGTGSPLRYDIQLTADREEVDAVLHKSRRQGVMLEKALGYITGFESAYGLELLASVHWAATRECPDTNLEAVTAFVQGWTSRKQELFTDRHIRIAYEHLRKQGLLPQ